VNDDRQDAETYEQLLERAATRGTERGADAVLAAATSEPRSTFAAKRSVSARSRAAFVIAGLSVAATIALVVGITIARQGDSTGSVAAGPGTTAAAYVRFRVAYQNPGSEDGSTPVGLSTPSSVTPDGGSGGTSRLETTIRARLQAYGVALPSVRHVAPGTVEVEVQGDADAAKIQRLLETRGQFALGEFDAAIDYGPACEVRSGAHYGVSREGTWPDWGAPTACFETRGLFGIARDPSQAPLAPGTTTQAAPRPSVRVEPSSSGTADVVLQDLSTPLPSFGRVMCNEGSTTCVTSAPQPQGVVAFWLDGTIIEVRGAAGEVAAPTGTRIAGLGSADAKVLAAILAGGSYEGDVVVAPSDSPPSTMAPPSTSAAPVPAPTRSCVPDPSVFPVDLAAQPPITPDQMPPDQGIIMADTEIATAYGASHADEFSGTVNLHGPERLAVAFTDHLDEHRAALLAQVPHPDRLVVVKGCASEAALRQIQTDAGMVASGRSLLRSASSDAIGGFVSISLRADGEATARELVERYGEKVAITVGTKPYPGGSTAPTGWYVETPIADACARTSFREAPIAGLEITPVPDSTTIRAGEDIHGEVRIVNHGPAPVNLEGDNPVTAVVVERGTRNIVAVFNGGIGGTGWGAALAPGDGAVDSFLGATGDCRPNANFALPPGEYGLVVPFGLGYDRKANGGIDKITVQWSTEVPITIVP
jgi:hypothetical protein